MSSECDVVRERAAELALDVLPGDERATLLAHLESCTSCRQEVEQLASAADALLLVVPPAEPPADLAARVRAAVAAEPPQLVQHRSSRRRWAVAIAAVAASVLLAIGVVAAVVATGSDDRPSEVALLAPDRSAIGAMSVNWDGQGWLTMTIERGSGTARYDCVLDLDDGTTKRFGPISIVDGKGSWGAPVPVPLDDVRAVRVVDAQGHTIATATLD